MGECYRTIIMFHIIPERKGGPLVSMWIDDRKGSISYEPITKELFETLEFSKMNIWEFYKILIERICKRHSSEIFNSSFAPLKWGNTF